MGWAGGEAWEGVMGLGGGGGGCSDVSFYLWMVRVEGQGGERARVCLSLVSSCASGYRVRLGRRGGHWALGVDGWWAWLLQRGY